MSGTEKVRIHLSGVSEEIRKAAECLEEKLQAEFRPDGVAVRGIGEAKALQVTREADGYVIAYSQPVEFFRGLAIVADGIRSGKCADTLQKRYFTTCGMMLDVSRGRVITVETAKDLLEYMALMGLNMMMLYTEDTYVMEKYPYFGYQKGAYTREELREIDRYALQFGIELIPCIQTLSHLATALRWEYAGKFKDTANTLYVGKEETYEFIRDMFRTVKECFTTHRIHIGLDEAGDVGTGKKRKLEGYIPAFELLTQHLQRVCEIAAEEGLDPMMWSDMFFKFGKLGGDYDYTSRIPEGFAKELPENIEMVYWDYCYDNGEVTDLFLKKHAEELGRKTIFAGGIWTWNRMTTNYDKTFSTANGQLGICKKHGVKDVFATVWCNTNSLFNLYSILPGLQMWAEHCYREAVSQEQLADSFRICTGYELADFLLLGVDDFPIEDREKYMDPGSFCINSSAQHFFNDPFTGLFDRTLADYDFEAHYKRYEEGLQKLPDMGKMEPVFEQARLLTGLLVRKSGIKDRLLEAYREREEQKLTECIGLLEELLAFYEQYHICSMEIWHRQNKPFGWDASDIRLGSMESRLKTVIRRVRDLAEGKVDSLPELEAEQLYFYQSRKPLTESGSFQSITTVGGI